MDQKLNDSEEARLRLLEELEGRKENRAENGAQEQSGGEKRRSAFGHINSFGNNNNASLHTPGKLLQDSEATPHKSRLPCSSPRADELYGSAAASEIQRLKDQLERQRVKERTVRQLANRLLIFVSSTGRPSILERRLDEALDHRVLSVSYSPLAISACCMSFYIFV